MSRRGRGLGAALALVCAAAAACGRPPRIALPSGAGSPFPAFAAAYQEAIADCAAATRLSASIRLAGHAGRTRLAARIDAGFAAPDEMRLEGFPRVNFGGRPFFVFAADGRDSTLLLPHDGRVLRGATPAAVVEALAGVALGAADLRTLVAGCGLPAGAPSDGRTFGDSWGRVDAGDTSLFLRRLSGRWRIAGATRAGLRIAYADFDTGRPATAQLTTDPALVDLDLRLTQIEVGPAFATGVFAVEVPRDAVPITLEELRRAGPLASEAPPAR